MKPKLIVSRPIYPEVIESCNTISKSLPTKPTPNGQSSVGPKRWVSTTLR